MSMSQSEDKYSQLIIQKARHIENMAKDRLYELYVQGWLQQTDYRRILSNVEIGRQSIYENLESPNYRPEIREKLLEHLVNNYEANLQNIITDIEGRKKQDAEIRLIEELRTHLLWSVEKFTENKTLPADVKEMAIKAIENGLRYDKSLNIVQKSAESISKSFQRLVRASKGR